VRSVRPRWVAIDFLPVLVCSGPELDETLLYPGESDVVHVTCRGVLLVSLCALVSVIIPEQGQTLESSQMERVFPARGVRLRVVCPPEDDVLDQSGLDVSVPEEYLLSHHVSVGYLPNIITVLALVPTSSLHTCVG